MPNELDRIGATLLRLVHHYRDAEELFEAVRKEHPGAGKKHIVLAALSVMIDQSQTDEIASKKLHKMAMDRRGHN